MPRLRMSNTPSFRCSKIAISQERHLEREVLGRRVFFCIENPFILNFCMGGVVSNGPAGFSGERKSPRDDDRWRDCWSSVGVFWNGTNKEFPFRKFQGAGY
jgi:hypothetical protein